MRNTTLQKILWRVSEKLVVGVDMYIATGYFFASKYGYVLFIFMLLAQLIFNQNNSVLLGIG